MAYNNRGNAYMELGEHEKALNDYSQAIRLDPNNPLPYLNRAWLFAVSPVAKIRDGQKALRDARKACELTNWQNKECLESLAAAYAELRDFKAAVKWQKKALGMFSEKQRISMRERLKLYEQAKPYRESIDKTRRQEKQKEAPFAPEQEKGERK